MARPSIYTDEILAEIVARLSEGEPLAQICRTEGFPAYHTVWEWQQRFEHVSKAIARARDLGEDVIASNLRKVARGQEGSTGDVQRDKLVVDTDLKLLAKWNPKKYGDKVNINHGGQPENPVNASLTISFVNTVPSEVATPIPTEEI